MNDSEECSTGNATIAEQLHSRIRFLEWKLDTDSRAHRETLCELMWKIASLETEVQDMNYARIVDKQEIVRLDGLVLALQQELRIARVSALPHEEIRSVLRSHYKEIILLQDSLTSARKEASEAKEYCCVDRDKVRTFLSDLKSDLRFLSNCIADCMKQMISFSRESSKNVGISTDLHHYDEPQLSAALKYLCEHVVLCQRDVGDFQFEHSNTLRHVEGPLIVSKDDDLKSEISRTPFVDPSCVGTSNHQSSADSTRLAELKAVANECSYGILELSKAREDIQKWSTFSATKVHVIIRECRESVINLDALKADLVRASETLCESHTAHVSLTEMVREHLCKYDREELFRQISQNIDKLQSDMQTLTCVSDASEQCLSETFARPGGGFSPSLSESLARPAALSHLKSWSTPPTSPTQHTCFHRSPLCIALSRPRSGLAAALLGRKAYFAGGTDGAIFRQDVEFYDFSKKSWGRTSPMPCPRVCFQLVSGGGQLFAIGGEDAGGSILTSCIAYDPGVDEWRELAPLCEARTGFAAVHVADYGLILVAGGWNGRETMVSVEVYSIELNLWSKYIQGAGSSMNTAPFSTFECPCQTSRSCKGEFNLAASSSKSEPFPSALPRKSQVAMGSTEMGFRLKESLDSIRDFLNSLNVKVCELIQTLRERQEHQGGWLHKFRANSCFFRAKIDMLKSQLSSSQSSLRALEIRRKAESANLFTVLQGILEENKRSLEDISEMHAFTEKIGEQVRLPRLTRDNHACHLQEQELQEGIEARASMSVCDDSLDFVFFPEQRFTIYEVDRLLSPVALACQFAQGEATNAKCKCLKLIEELERVRQALVRYQKIIRVVSDECKKGISDVLDLKQANLHVAEQHARHNRIIRHLANECQSCLSDAECLLARPYIFSPSVNDAPVQIDKGIMVNGLSPFVKEQEQVNEMIHLLGSEVIRRLEAEKEIQVLAQRNEELSEQCLEFVKLASSCINTNAPSEDVETSVHLGEDRSIEICENQIAVGEVDSTRTTQEKDHERQLVQELDATRAKLETLIEERGILEEALELEMISNKNLRFRLSELEEQNVASKDSTSPTFLDAQRRDTFLVENGSIIPSPPNEQSLSSSSDISDQTVSRKGICITKQADCLVSPYSSSHEAKHDFEATFSFLMGIIVEKELDLESIQCSNQSLSDQIILLISKLSEVLDEVQERKRLCVEGRCETGVKQQQTFASMADQMSKDAVIAEKMRIMANEDISFCTEQVMHWKEKYESCISTISRLEHELLLYRSEDGVQKCTDVRRTIMASQRDENPSSQTLLWRLSHNTVKGCIQELLSTTPRFMGHLQSPERQEISTSLSCRKNFLARDDDYFGSSSESDSELVPERWAKGS